MASPALKYAAALIQRMHLKRAALHIKLAQGGHDPSAAPYHAQGLGTGYENAVAPDMYHAEGLTTGYHNVGNFNAAAPGASYHELPGGPLQGQYRPLQHTSWEPRGMGTGMVDTPGSPAQSPQQIRWPAQLASRVPYTLPAEAAQAIHASQGAHPLGGSLVANLHGDPSAAAMQAYDHRMRHSAPARPSLPSRMGLGGLGGAALKYMLGR